MFGNELINEKNKKKNRLIAIDYLKTISILLVIFTHAISAKFNDRILGPFWIDMAVPIFMIISGLTYSLSAKRKDINKFSEWFIWDNLKKKLTRVLIPYAVIISIEVGAYTIIDPQSFGKLLYKVTTGGWGPGSYYIPILLQLMVIFPLLFISFNKYPKSTMILAFSIHLAFDIYSNMLPIETKIYRLLIFRYLAFIMMGIMLYHYPRKVKKKGKELIVLAILSGAYIWMCTYYGYKPFIFTKWNSTSLPTVFWAFGIVVLGFKYLNYIKDNIFINIAKIISKASLHIYLVQMVYFHFDFDRFGLVFTMMAPIIIGIFFYYIETGKTVNFHFRKELRDKLYPSSPFISYRNFWQY
ncbi:acyltransferase [Clostridium sp. D2Q-11]|uniref:Acyltransferase n=1 Tax=Anaeromonas frigoriresistens TaxID=2683708 RepID=A0A942URD9_9FIRM|nr:acyltransferase [Anaeromonas frigoriresistens]MBS4537869.1 acyltransferase [Anaeromonas frigoriresistens]